MTARHRTVSSSGGRVTVPIVDAWVLHGQLAPNSLKTRPKRPIELLSTRMVMQERNSTHPSRSAARKPTDSKYRHDGTFISDAYRLNRTSGGSYSASCVRRSTQPLGWRRYHRPFITLSAPTRKTHRVSNRRHAIRSNWGISLPTLGLFLIVIKLTRKTELWRLKATHQLDDIVASGSLASVGWNQRG